MRQIINFELSTNLVWLSFTAQDKCFPMKNNWTCMVNFRSSFEIEIYLFDSIIWIENEYELIGKKLKIDVKNILFWMSIKFRKRKRGFRVGRILMRVVFKKPDFKWKANLLTEKIHSNRMIIFDWICNYHKWGIDKN